MSSPERVGGDGLVGAGRGEAGSRRSVPHDDLTSPHLGLQTVVLAARQELRAGLGLPAGL